MIHWIFSKEVLVLWNWRFRVSIAFSCCTLVTFPATVWRGALGTAVTFLYTESMCCWLSALFNWCSVRRQTWRSVLDDTYAVTKNEGASVTYPADLCMSLSLRSTHASHAGAVSECQKLCSLYQTCNAASLKWNGVIACSCSAAVLS